MDGRIRIRGSAGYAGQDWSPVACIIRFLPDLFRNCLPLVYHAIEAISTQLLDPDFMRAQFDAANAMRHANPKLRKDGCYRQAHRGVRLDTIGFMLGIIQYLNVRADGSMYCILPDGDEFLRGLGMGRITSETELSEHCAYVGREMAEQMGWIEIVPVKERKDGKWRGLAGIIILTRKFFIDFGLIEKLDKCISFIKDKVKKGYKETKRRLRDGLRLGTSSVGTFLQRVLNRADKGAPVPTNPRIQIPQGKEQDINTQRIKIRQLMETLDSS